MFFIYLYVLRESKFSKVEPPNSIEFLLDDNINFCQIQISVKRLQ